MSNITHRRGSVPTLPNTAQAYKEAQRVLVKFYVLQHGSEPSKEEKLGSFCYSQESLSAMDQIRPEAEAALAELKKQARPATLEEITIQIAKLGRSFNPSGREGDISGFGSELLDYVLAENPAIGDIDEARRDLVLNRKLRFMPAIYEVIESIATARGSRELMTSQIERLVSDSIRDRIAAHLEEEDRRRQAWKQEWERQLRVIEDRKKERIQ
jgi:hypothetical protein